MCHPSVSTLWTNRRLPDVPEREQTVLVVDLGARTFDLALVERVADRLTVLRTGGCRRLGGQDFDRRVAHWLLSVRAYGAACECTQAG